MAGGRRTAFPQGTPSWQGARSLGGARQVQLGATARRRLANGGPGGLAARERAGGLVWTAGREKAKEGRR